MGGVLYKSIIVLFLILSFLTSCGSQRLYERAKELDTIVAYQEYIRLFPILSSYTKLAEKRLVQLKSKEKLSEVEELEKNNPPVSAKDEYRKEDVEENLNIKFYGICTQVQVSRMVANDIKQSVINKICRKS